MSGLDREAGERRTVAAAFLKIEAHEALCAERYRGINEKLHWIMGGLATLFLGLLGWMAVQLYTLEPLRVASANTPAPDHSSPPPALRPAP